MTFQAYIRNPAPHSYLLITFVALMVLSPLALAFDEIKLFAEDGAAGDEFGHDIATDGSWAVIGARSNDNENGQDAGAAYIFKKDDNGQWSQQAKLLPDDGMADDSFGEAVGISGNNVAISARNAVYIFEHDTEFQWHQTAKLSGDNTDIAIDSPSVSINGDRVVMEAKQQHDEQTLRLGFHVFERDGNGEWRRQATVMDLVLDPRFPSNGHLNVSISGNTVVCTGSIFSGPGSITSYKTFAYIYEPGETGAWSRRLILGDARNFQSGKTGHSKTHYDAAVTGDTVALRTIHSVHRIRNNERSQYTRIHLWVRTALGRWRRAAGVSASLEPFDSNGEVAIADNQVMVTRIGKDDKAAYVLIPTANGKWRRQRLHPQGGASRDYQSDSLAVSRGVAMVGAQDDTLGKDAGAVYVFNLQSVPDSFIRFSAEPAQIVKDKLTATLLITRTPQPSIDTDDLKSASVDCVSVEGTAEAGEDYRRVWSTLQWAAGDIESKTCTIPLVEDGRPEIKERLIVQLDGLRGPDTSYGAPTKTTVRIVDADPPSVQFRAQTHRVTEDKGTAYLRVKLTGTPPRLTKVHCIPTASGNATPNEDYQAVGTTLHWRKGDNSDRLCKIHIIDDQHKEQNEHMFVSLVNIIGGPFAPTIGDRSSIKFIIFDND